MIGVAANPSTAMFSHNGGWTYTIIDQLRSRFNAEVEIVKNPESIHEYDSICINEGLNYKEGSWNFFGGMQERSISMVNELTKYNGSVYCYNEKICWHSLFKRKELRDSSLRLGDTPRVNLLSTEENHGSDIIIGDSHSVSIYKPGYNISRNDGKTLFGALKYNGILKQFDFTGYNNIVLYFGNIDIRFHVDRNNGLEAIDKLVKDYSSFVGDLKEKGYNVTVQGLLPIESDDRKIPGTGLYKGKPFYGSREDRQIYVDYFNQQMEYNAMYYDFVFRYWDLPLDGFDSPKFKCMESRQSVHLRPSYYLFNDKLFTHVG